jgi:hypothetical protein
VDTNGDGILEDNEITSTSYVCSAPPNTSTVSTLYGEISGTVFRFMDPSPASTVVTVGGTRITTLTNAQGTFVIDHIPIGYRDVVLSFPGFDTTIIPNVLVLPGSLDLPPVTLYGSSGEVLRNVASVGAVSPFDDTVIVDWCPKSTSPDPCAVEHPYSVLFVATGTVTPLTGVPRSEGPPSYGPDGLQLVYGPVTGTACPSVTPEPRGFRLFDIAAQTTTTTPPYVAAALSGDRRFLFAVSADNARIERWDIRAKTRSTVASCPAIDVLGVTRPYCIPWLQPNYDGSMLLYGQLEQVGSSAGSEVDLAKRRLWTAASGSSAIDTALQRAPGRCVADAVFSPNETRVLLGDYSSQGGIEEWNTSTQSFDWGLHPADGSRPAHAYLSDGRILSGFTVLDPSRGPTIVITGNPSAGGEVLGPDKKHVAFTASGNLAMFDVATSRVSTVAPASGTFVFAPDGRRVLFTTSGSPGTSIVDVASAQVVSLDHAAANLAPVFSKDGLSLIGSPDIGGSSLWDLRSGNRRDLHVTATSISMGNGIAAFIAAQSNTLFVLSVP